MALKRKAVALLSGGLDSMLAVRVILDQGIPVTAVRFLTHFGCDPVTAGSCGHDVEPLVKMWGADGLDIKMAHLGQDYIDMVKNPPHGRGKNMNPCIDCRMMMLTWGRELLEKHDAGFMVTGEVLNQRPMSQNRSAFHVIDKQIGLTGLVLRPLSAKLLEPTLPELEGVVDRQRLLDISGRGRTRQYAMAKQYGITDIPQPAGGCLLTDPGYSARLRDLWAHDADASTRDINFLRAGRHFRVSDACKIIVGRNKQENDLLEAFAGPDDTLVRLADVVGPVTIVRGAHDDETVFRAAALTVRYGDGPKDDAPQAVLATRGGLTRTLRVAPARDDDYVDLRVGVPARGRVTT
jgi:tRNA U34 2-thiouridine synthase MnmA/TrmU